MHEPRRKIVAASILGFASPAWQRLAICERHHWARSPKTLPFLLESPTTADIDAPTGGMNQ